MTAKEIDTAIQAFAAAGADRGVFYLSTPITTGRREFELMEKHRVTSRQEFRERFNTEWRELVVKRNESDAITCADLFVETVALGRVVINPVHIHRDHWDRGDYDVLWDRLIREFPTFLVPVSSWAYSRGARLEVALAIQLSLPVVNLDGSPRSPEGLLKETTIADEEISSRGWNRLSEPLPPVQSPARPQSAGEKEAATLAAPPYESYHRQVQVWLAKERSYQVRKFGLQLDDQHTSESGLSIDGWWTKQLAQYLHRARILGLETPVGRQALAKYVATGCGLLESTVRVFGWLPASERPSGDISPGKSSSLTPGE